MTYSFGARIVRSDMDGNPDRFRIGDDEICLVFREGTRRALIRLLGSFSRDDYKRLGLSDDEATALNDLWTRMGMQ